MNTYSVSLTFADGTVHQTSVQAFTPILAIGIARERLTELPGAIVEISCKKIS